MKTGLILSLLLAASFLCHGADEPIIIDHGSADVTLVPIEWIDAARNALHIAYGHTSHGSQVTDGMTGLVSFTGGCGGPQFAWNNGGSGGALDLHDGAMGGDCGYYPQWVDNTRTYLNNPANSDCNVIIWSWCGQHSGYSQQDMIDKYLAPMTQLEVDYPNVLFVYMTGHLNYWEKTNTDARNQQIRDYCVANNKILYDFAHIESYDPDGTYFEFANDDCNYWNSGGVPQGNWAEEWQNSHVLNVDWYNCTCAHSRPLNGNQKAYAVWQLWARLAGWPGVETLKQDNDQISVSTGGTVNFDLNAGHLYGGRDFLLCATQSGTSPGTLLPGGLATLPLNRDWLTDYVIQHLAAPSFTNFWGSLDGQGEASAVLVLAGLPSSWVGTTLHFAWATANPWDFASNALAVDVLP
jgi:hypothetical protein